MDEDSKRCREKPFPWPRRSPTHNDTPWPLEHGERLLWDGVPDSAPTKTARRIARRCVLYAVILVIPGAYMLAPLGGTVDGTPAHAFPPRMGEEERKSVAALLLPGERLLWCGRPEPQVSWVADGIWYLFAAGLWLWAIHVACIHGASPCDMGYFSKCADILHTLFVRIGGVFGWLTGCVAGLMFLPMSIGLFVFPLFFFAVPWLGRRPIRLTRFLVTDRRAWTMRRGNPSRDIGGVSFLFGDSPGAEKRGKRYTVFLLVRDGKVFFVPHPLASTTFSDLSESDASAAVDALNVLRRASGHRDCGCVTCPGERP